MNFKVGFQTDIGRKRQQNQDNGAAWPELGLFIVADGMGGHQGGEIASAMAVDGVTHSIREAQKQSRWDPREVLAHAIQKANEDIYRKAMDERQLHGMGTTTTALLFSEEFLTIGHVGDSRCYFFRPGAVWQLTRDHSLVQEKLRAGLITREQLKTDRMKNVITRSVGFEQQVNVELYEVSVQPGDVFVLCSDGLTGMIDEAQMLQVVQRELFGSDQADAIKNAVADLVKLANDSGGDDNITVVAVQVLGPKQG